jgi:glycerophosphoryl diester phosphodiesterase
VEKLHKAGLFVNVWTVNKEEEMKRLLDEVGVDMVTTEYYFE